MRIEIDIPKEFEEHFNHDRFDDSLHRLYADIHLLAGKYERELVEMLIKAFKESKPAYDIDKAVDELEQRSKEYNSGVRLHGKPEEMLTDDAIEIVKHGGVSDDVCEWRLMKDGSYQMCKGEIMEYVRGWKYCPYCGKKIKVVE